MQIAGLALILACAFPASAAFSEDPAASAAPKAYEHIDGVLKKISRSGKIFTFEDSTGGKTRIELPADVRVEKRIALSELAEGDSIHAQFSSEGGDAIGTALIDRRPRTLSRPVWDGRPLPERPRRYQGWISSIDVASRRLAIERIDGEIRWFSLKMRTLFVAIGRPDILNEGDSALVTFKGPAGSGRPVLIQAESSKVKRKR